MMTYFSYTLLAALPVAQVLAVASAVSGTQQQISCETEHGCGVDLGLAAVQLRQEKLYKAATHVEDKDLMLSGDSTFQEFPLIEPLEAATTTTAADDSGSGYDDQDFDPWNETDATGEGDDMNLIRTGARSFMGALTTAPPTGDSWEWGHVPSLIDYGSFNNELHIDFCKAKLRDNNLGGFGPNKTAEPHLYIENVAVDAKGDPVDLKVMITGAGSTYFTNDPVKNTKSGCFLNINLNCGTDAWLKFVFWDPKTNVMTKLGKKFWFKVHDLDQGLDGKCKEWIVVQKSVLSYSVSKPTELSTGMMPHTTYDGTVTEKPYWRSGKHGTGDDNPDSSTAELTALQAQRTVALLFDDVKKFLVTIKTYTTAAADNGVLSRNVLFSGVPDVPICDATNFVDVTFKGANVVNNNLGGRGPNTADPADRGLEYSPVANIGGNISLRITNLTEWRSNRSVDWDRVHTGKGSTGNVVMGGKGGKINIFGPSDTDFKFEFFRDGELFVMPEFYMTALDIDSSRQGSMKEQWTFHGVSGYIVNDGAEFIHTPINSDTIQFLSDMPGPGCDNPKDPMNLITLAEGDCESKAETWTKDNNVRMNYTTNQRLRTGTVVYKNVSSFTVNMASICTLANACPAFQADRIFYFAWESQLSSQNCTTAGSGLPAV